MRTDTILTALVMGLVACGGIDDEDSSSRVDGVRKCGTPKHPCDGGAGGSSSSSSSSTASSSSSASASSGGGTACDVQGGTASSPTNLASIVNGSGSCTVFVLGDGYYGQTTITRAGITVKAAHACAASLAPELVIQAADVTVDGVSVTAPGVGIHIYESGVRVANSCVQGFGKSQWGVGIQVYQEALDPNHRVVIEGNHLDDWGGALYSGAIAIGKANDNYDIYSAVTVEVLRNRLTGGPTTQGMMNSGIQSFHPFIATGNFIDTVDGSAVQNKTFNSHIACNEAVHITGDGALYNRRESNNVWEYNLVHDSEIAIDHFMGDSTVFRGNVIYDVGYLGRVKDQGIGSTNVLFENNTFYHTTGWAAFIWDASSGGTISNVVWRRNIFHTLNGSSINTSATLDPVWDEYENVFWNASKPATTTGATTGSSIVANPLLANPGVDFTVQATSAIGKGAPWPLPCQ